MVTSVEGKAWQPDKAEASLDVYARTLLELLYLVYTHKDERRDFRDRKAEDRPLFSLALSEKQRSEATKWFSKIQK